ncbi:MAG: DUF3038 domain-containing protein, partial [Cyanobium sp.]
IAAMVQASASSATVAAPRPQDVPHASGPAVRDEQGGALSLPRRGLERLDLMLLCLEALDLNGGEAMLWISANLGLQNSFPNRVELWKRRCFNPMRRACRRGDLSSSDAEGLMRILCVMADRLYPMLRTLLSSSEPTELNAERWRLFEGRLAELLRERMNPRRSAVQKLLDGEEGAAERRQMIQALSLVAGEGGYGRLRASLLDAAA